MTIYKVFFSTTASTCFTVEADSKEDAVERAYDEAEFPTICAQCSGWGRDDQHLELGDVWEADDDIDAAVMEVSA